MDGKNIIFIIFLFFIFPYYVVYTETVLTSFTAKVGAGNYTYYTLHELGEITLILNSLEGDADLYVSEQVSKPAFDNYDMSSVTCGSDIVTIPSHFRRPTAIGVYGHIHSPISTYKLTAILNYTNTESGNYNTGSYNQASIENSQSNNTDDESYYGWGSVVWDVLEFLLKILLEVLL